MQMHCIRFYCCLKLKWNFTFDSLPYKEMYYVLLLVKSVLMSILFCTSKSSLLFTTDIVDDCLIAPTKEARTFTFYILCCHGHTVFNSNLMNKG